MQPKRGSKKKQNPADPRFVMRTEQEQLRWLDPFPTLVQQPVANPWPSTPSTNPWPQPQPAPPSTNPWPQPHPPSTNPVWPQHAPQPAPPSTNPVWPQPAPPSTNPVWPQPAPPSTNPVWPQPAPPSTNPVWPQPAPPSTNPVWPQPAPPSTNPVWPQPAPPSTNPVWPQPAPQPAPPSANPAWPQPQPSEPQQKDVKLCSHVGVRCDGCGQNPLLGTRHKCLNCVNFDLCSACEAKEGSHTSTHVFMQLKAPLPEGFNSHPMMSSVPIIPIDLYVRASELFAAKPAAAEQRPGDAQRIHVD